MQTLGSLYYRYVNYGYYRTGTLFEGRYKSSVVQQEAYFLSCLRYTELNPVRAGMTKDPGDYKWSSYSAHAFDLNPRMWSPHALYVALGSNDAERQSCYRQWIGESIATDVMGKIRHCLNTR